MNNIFKHLRVNLLENDIIRFEYSPNDNFVDKETLFVSNKKPSFEELKFSKNNTVKFTYSNFVFEFDENDPLNTLIVIFNNTVVYKYHEIKNSGELPLPNKTPMIFPLMDSPRLLLPEDGYVPNNNGFILEKDVKDLYLLLCNNDYLKLRKQYIQLTGINEMPRLKNFGLFSSRYFEYTQKSAMDMIRAYEQHKIPLDTFIVDTDWRDMEKLAGCGYTINEKLFPNMPEFFRFAHQHKVQVMMNDHPLPLRSDLTALDEEEIEYRTENLTKLFKIGLDGWWYDRNWTCKLNSVDKNIASESIGNYLFHDVTKQFNLGFTLDPQVYERNLVMSNINNVENGYYKSILDSRSHRYSLQWSGDVCVQEQPLRNEIVNLNKCANNMIAYYSSDIGGHEGTPTKAQYIRWMQYGAFSPVMRPHSTKNVKKYREPWAYDKSTLDITRNYIYMRYRLLNSFYTAAFKNVDSGLGICSPLSLYYPSDKRCYKEDTSFIINNSILVSPVTGTEKPKELSSKEFTKKLRVTIYPNAEFKGPKFYSKSVKSFKDIEKFYKNVKTKHKRVKKFSIRVKGELLFKNDYQLAINNELNSRVYLNKKEVFNNNGWTVAKIIEFASVKKNKRYQLEIDMLQNRKPTEISIIFYKLLKNRKQKIYLPEGEWFNIFHRNVYQGKRYIKEKFKLDETPVFVKAGSLLALYKKVDNISNMSLKTIVYDYYPSKKVELNDYFYEDDGITTGYQIGEYRKNFYKTSYKDDRYVIELKGSNKILDDDIKIRDCFFKVHVRDNETIEQVLVNGESLKFKRHDHNKKALPFLDDKFARDSKTLTFKFRQTIKDDYKIELIVRHK